LEVLPTARKVARAAREILYACENQNPYDLSEHSSVRRGNPIDCEEPEIWADDNRLIPEDELDPAFFASCSACAYQYNLWSAILEQSYDEGEDPTTEYGDRIFAALSLEQSIEDGFFTQSDLIAKEYDDLKVLKQERRKLESFRAWERAQEAAQQAAQAKQRG
jgi:hypothetical protein